MVNTFIENMGALGGSQSSYEGRFGTSMTATATGPDSTGALLNYVNLAGATLNATGEKYGLFDGGVTALNTGTDDYASPSPIYTSNISGTSTDGIGIFSFMDFRNDAGKVTGKTTNGIGLEAYNITMTDQYETGNAPEVNGTTGTGFGILMRNYDSYSDSFTIGNISISAGKLNGQAQDGTGIMANISGDVSNLADIEVSGTADTGQGIIGAQLNFFNQVQTISGAPRVDFTATSNGSSTTTMATIKEMLSSSDEFEGIDLDKFPSSVGVVALQGLRIESPGFDIDFTATAPVSVDGSYGVYSPESEAGMYIYGMKYTNMVVTGDIGIQAGRLELFRSEDYSSDADQLFAVDIDSRTAGINASVFIVDLTTIDILSEDMWMDIEAPEGNGITVTKGLDWRVTQEQSKRFTVNITAADTGISAPDPTSEDNPYPAGFSIQNVDLIIDGARNGIFAIKQGNYYIEYSAINITTSETGMVLDEEGGSESSFTSLMGTTMEINSGTYGLKLNQLPYVNFGTTTPDDTTPKDRQINVIADQYPIWIGGSDMVSMGNDPGYDEEGQPLDYTFSFVATSRNLIPDTADYPAFYVENYHADTQGTKGVQIIENYQTAVSQPFNTDPSSPYKTANPFNVEEYGNYAWSATRTDDGGNVVIDESRIANNQLSTNDTSYTEANLTASREEYLTDERIFNIDVSGSDEKIPILHQINMLVRREEQHRVTYEAPDADSGDVPVDNNLYSPGDPVTVATQGNLVRNDYTFIGWLNSEDGQIYQNPNLTTPTTYTMGTADVTFTAQWQSNSIIEELRLIDGQIPDNLRFGTHDIQYDQDKTFYATDDGTDNENSSATNLTTGAVGVLDTRLDTQGWRLRVSQIAQFQTSSNQELSAAELGFRVGPADTSQNNGGIPTSVSDENVTLVPGNTQDLASASSGQGKGTFRLPIERFTLTVPKTSEKYSGQSTTVVEWTLSNVP